MDRPSPPTGHTPMPPLVVWILISAGAWTISSAIGQLLGGLVASFFASPWQMAAVGLANGHWGQRLTLILRHMLITISTTGVILGVGTGVIQAAFLRTYAVPPRRWLMGSCIAWAIVTMLDTWRTYGVMSAGRLLFAGGLLLTSSGLLVVISWLILRHYLPQAYRWAIAGVVGYVLSSVVGIVQSAIILASLSRS